MPLTFLGHERRATPERLPPRTSTRDAEFVLAPRVRPLSIDVAVWPPPEHDDPGVDVAVAVWVGTPEEAVLFGAALGVCPLPSGVELLGYDVADRAGTSVLSNAAYRDVTERNSLSRFARCLNAHHLFTRIEDALAFIAPSEQRVPEHAPVYVYGLFVGGKSE